jgi:hypothetical protein
VDVRWAGVQPGVVNVVGDGVEFVVTTDGQDWRVAWHPPRVALSGARHGSAAICVAGDRVVLVSGDGERWVLPGGRPEPGEDWADTLRARSAGVSRGVCVRGPQEGLVLVRALWRAEVRLEPLGAAV